MGVADYLVGRRLYNGYSSSPHKGTDLDPMGYIERDADGGRRSGLAQAAAERLNMQMPTTNYAGMAPKAIPQQAAKTEKESSTLRNTATATAKKTSRTATGKVKKRRHPGNRLMPLDPEIAQLRIGLNRQRAQALQDFARTSRNIGTDYGVAVRSQKKQHPRDVAQLLGAFGARGMGESGGAITGRTDLESRFQETLADLARTKSRGLGDLSASKKAYLNQYQNALERLLIQQAQRASGEAGSLGLKAILKKLLRDYGRR